ncbi:MAG: 3'(2'),5'-bisphosphate nucleotidase CysQ [Rhodobacteraceae bacterium]|nr:3'(2'),5'-bisphosphate nucleotidase CysQ [Paracoccaceae bacterium]
MPVADDLALLSDAARAGGNVAMAHFRAAPEAWEKAGGQGPVSVADLAVDRALRARLLTARPDYGWLSEESLRTPGEAGAPMFIVDPIDGTRAFLAGEKAFAVAIAVVQQGVPLAGVVHLPAMGLTYAARAGGGATCNGAALQTSSRDGLEGARVLAARAQLAPERWPGGPPPVERHFRPSLAWRLCLVAEGAFDAMLTLRDAWDWDIAAGALIVAEAGGRVTDRAGMELRFGTEAARNAGVIAAPGAVHAQLMARLSPQPAA